MKKFLIVFLATLIVFTGFPIPGSPFSGGQTALANSYYTNGSTTVSFPESTGSYKSKTIYIPDLYKVRSISVDNGNVSYSINGDYLKVNVSNGDWVNRDSYWDSTKYSKFASAYRTSSSNSFSYTYSYSDSYGYSGTLYKDGRSRVISGEYISYDTKFVTNQSSSYYSSGGYSGSLSRYQSGGSYTPSDSKTAYDTKTGYGWRYYVCSDSGNWTTTGADSTSQPSSISYNQDGYSGTLSRYNTVKVSDTGAPSGSCSEHDYYQREQQYKAYYKGTVTKPAEDTREYAYEGTVTREESDTRIYRQDYDGTAYKGGTSYRNYTYAYTVQVEYQRNKSPVMSLDAGIENQRIADYPGYNTVEVKGSVYDPDNDSVTIRATLKGHSTSTIVSNTKGSQSFRLTFDQSQMKLPNGVYTVNLVATDGKNGRQTKSFQITIRDAVFDGDYLLVNEWTQFLTTITDYESDPIIQEQFNFTHTPTHFQYSDRAIGDERVTRGVPYEQKSKGVIANSGQWINQPYDYFERVGKYEVLARAKDNPKDDPNFTEFQKWSEPTTPLTLFVHRKPAAEIEPYMTYDGEVTIIDRSLDWDSYSQGERGIKQKTWSYRDIYSGTWIAGKPTNVDSSRTYEVRQRVLDYQGEYSETIATMELVYVVPNVPPEAGFEHRRTNQPATTFANPPAFYYEYDTIEIKSTALDLDNDSLNISYEIITPSGSRINESFFQVMDYSNVVFNFQALESGTYRVIQTVDDGNHPPVIFEKMIQVQPLTIEGMVFHTAKWREIHESLGNHPTQFYSGEEFSLGTVVTDHPVADIKVYFTGQQDNGNTAQRTSSLSVSSLDAYSFVGYLYDPAFAQSGTALKVGSTPSFVFEVTYENGAVREDTVQVEIIGDVYDVFKIHETY